MTVNREMFKRILNQITQHPETHDQATFEWTHAFHVDNPPACGTTRCVAGWAVFFDLLDRDPSITSIYGPDQNHIPTTYRAQQILGLPEQEASHLFYELDDEEAVEICRTYAYSNFVQRTVS